MGENPIQSLIDKDFPISQVRAFFGGLKRVSPKYLYGEVKPLEAASTVGELHSCVVAVRKNLLELGVLADVNVEVDAGPNKSVVDVTFKCEEHRDNYNIGANINRLGEATADAEMRIPACFGGLTSFGVTASTTWLKSRNYSARLTNPRFYGSDVTSELEVSSTMTDMTTTSSYSEGTEGAVLMFKKDNHLVQVEMTNRNIIPQTGENPSSYEVQSARLHTAKASAKYVYTKDKLEEEHGHHVSGHFLRSSTELAGLLGDVNFIKSELFMSKYVKLPFGGLVGSLSGFGGTILSKETTPIQDRFFLGGASGNSTMMKGYAFRGLGPRGSHTKEIPDALGSDTALSMTAMISKPFALCEGQFAHSFAFFSWAAMLNSRTGPALVKDLKKDSRFSAGLGLAYPLMPGTLMEISIAQPLGSKSDTLQRIQFGLRVQGA